MNFSDPSGHYSMIEGYRDHTANGSSLSWSKISRFIKSMFGFGYSKVTRQYTRPPVELIAFPLNWLVTVQNGTYETETLSRHGDSSKFISGFIEHRVDKPFLSSAGAKINIAGFSLSDTLGFNNSGLSLSYSDGYTTFSTALSINLTELKIGCETSITTMKSENVNKTEYSNSSITFWGLFMLFYSIYTGQTPSPQLKPELA